MEPFVRGFEMALLGLRQWEATTTGQDRARLRAPARKQQVRSDVRLASPIPVTVAAARPAEARRRHA